MELARTIFHELLHFGILIFEYMGLTVLIVSGIIGFINFLRRRPSTRLKLAKGLALGLEFKLAAEILKTVLVTELADFIAVGSVIVLRAALALLIHFEIKNEESELKLAQSVKNIEEQIIVIKEQVNELEVNEQQLEKQIHEIEEHEQQLEKQIHEIEEHEQQLEKQIHEIEEHEQQLEKQIHEIEEHENELEKKINELNK
jgi:uncharacterized membrane protein/prefoldin subunit 5